MNWEDEEKGCEIIGGDPIKPLFYFQAYLPKK
jgi:hypothetical protein